MANHDNVVALERDVPSLAGDDAVQRDGHGLAGVVVAVHDMAPFTQRHDLRPLEVVAVNGGVGVFMMKPQTTSKPIKAHVRARVSDVEVQGRESAVGKIVSDDAVVRLEAGLCGNRRETGASGSNNNTNAFIQDTEHVMTRP